MRKVVADDLFNGAELVGLLVELPEEIYDSMHRAYLKGETENQYELTESQWFGGFICNALKKMFDKNEATSAPTATNKELVEWLRSQINFHENSSNALMRASDKYHCDSIAVKENEAIIRTYQNVMNRILGFGRI